MLQITARTTPYRRMEHFLASLCKRRSGAIASDRRKVFALHTVLLSLQGIDANAED
jgi:hypothetical protein